MPSFPKNQSCDDAICCGLVDMGDDFWGLPTKEFAPEEPEEEGGDAEAINELRGLVRTVPYTLKFSIKFQYFPQKELIIFAVIPVLFWQKKIKIDFFDIF